MLDELEPLGDARRHRRLNPISVPLELVDDESWNEQFDLSLVDEDSERDDPALPVAALAQVATQTTTAVSNTVIGGAAIGLGLTNAMNSSWGFSWSRTSVPLIVSGLRSNFVKLGLPVFPLALRAVSSPPSGARLAAGLAELLGLVAALIVLGMLLGSREAAARVGTTATRVASAIRSPFGRRPVEGWELASRPDARPFGAGRLKAPGGTLQR